MMRYVLAFINLVTFLSFILIGLQSCEISKTELLDSGIVQVKTQFYDTAGKITFAAATRVWYQDSSTIQEIKKIRMVTDTNNITTTTYDIVMYRYIDIKSRTWYDYQSLSDTSVIINKGSLPDSGFRDQGWSYFSNKVNQIRGNPDMLEDTVMGTISYKRAKFNSIQYDPQKIFSIGYFRCDNKWKMLSLEKDFSKSLNCTLTKICDYSTVNYVLIGSMEIESLADTLSQHEMKIFSSWNRNVVENPVSR